MKIKYVAQEQEYGCVIASIAMVLGWKYRDVAAYFENDFSKRGINAELAETFLCERGFSVIEKRAKGFMDVYASNKRMLVPFAAVHLISGTQFIDSKTNHCFVMDAKGKIFNPGSTKPQNALTDYYFINRVFGFWPDAQKLK